MPGTIPDLVTDDPAIQATAIDQAKANLRAKNTKEFKSTITCAGLLCFPNGVAIQSGINVTFANKGIFNGKWIIEKETLHIVEGKFITELFLRKCIDPAPLGEIVGADASQNDPAVDGTDPDPDEEVPET
jgi:hypothetical protein